MKRLAVCCLLLFFLPLPPNSQAEDWTHWGGPTRNNVWHEDGLLESFPPAGPTIVWRTPVSGGYAGPAVSEGSVFVSDFVSKEHSRKKEHADKVVPQRTLSDGMERVLCLDEQSGGIKWKHEYPVKYSIAYASGPRCTPTVDQGKVYTLGAEGNLFCFNKKTGDILWSKDFRKLYVDKTPIWGYASHPLVDGQKLICVVGGEGSYAVAFDKDTGAELWRAITAVEQGYSPPMIIEAQGVRQLILMRPDAVTSVDPDSGREYWSVPYNGDSSTIIMSPVFWNEQLFVGGFNNRNLLLKLLPDRPAAKAVWRDKRKHGISPLNVQPYVDANVMYGVDQNGELMAVELPSGKRLWATAEPISKRRVHCGTAFFVRQADRYWLFNDQGEIVIGKLTPHGYEEIDRQKVIEPTSVAYGRAVVWCMPAFANRRMYVRNDEECICVDLAAGQ